MTRLERQAYRPLTLVVALLAALMWSSLGIRAIVTDNAPSSRALLACASIVLAGIALGSVYWTLAASKRARSRSADAGMVAEMKVPNALLGLMIIGLGADSILDPSLSAMDWALLVATSLVGGMNLGVAFMSIADEGTPSEAPRQSVGDPQPGP